MHSLCSSSPTKLRSALEVVEEEELRDQLELEPLGVVRIADRSDIARRRLRVTTVGDLRDPSALELQLVPQFELRVAPGVEEHLTMHANCTCLDTVYCHFNGS